MSEVEPSGYTPEGVVDATPDTADRQSQASDGAPRVTRKAAASTPSPAGHAEPLIVM